MICENCGKEFNSQRKTAKYCSDKCRKLAFLEVSVPVSVPKQFNKPKYPQGFCHSCGKEFAEVFREIGCICLECTNKNITHESLGLNKEDCV